MEAKGIPASALSGGFGRPRNGTGSTSSTAPGATTVPRTRPSVSLPPGVTQAQYTAALQACRGDLPSGFGGAANSPAFAAYRNCLQLHGVTLPTPGSSTTTPGSSTATSTPGAGRGFGGLNQNDPTVKAAMTACANLRPAGGPGSSSTTTNQ
jgi:hypothetical protein